MLYGLCSLLKAVELPIVVNFCVIWSLVESSLIGNHTTSSLSYTQWNKWSVSWRLLLTTYKYAIGYLVFSTKCSQQQLKWYFIVMTIWFYFLQKVETFLSKDINYLITANPPAKPTGNEDKYGSPESPSISTPSPFNMGASPSPSNPESVKNTIQTVS